MVRHSSSFPTSTTAAMGAGADASCANADERGTYDSLIDLCRRSVRSGLSSGRDATAVAAIWLNTVVADRSFAREIESWLGETFNDLSTVYSQAMDAKWLEQMRTAIGDMTPTDHRFLDSHTLWAAWEAVRDALPHDTLAQEIGGYFSAIASDLSSTMGLPVVTLTRQTLDVAVDTLRSGLGIPRDWTFDILSYNANELIGCSVGVLAAVLNWNATETQEFARLASSLSLSAFISANPLLAVVTLAMFAKAFTEARRKGEFEAALLGLGKGGITTGAALVTAGIVGGPAWLGVIAGVCIGVYVEGRMRQLTTGEIRGYVERQLEFLHDAIHRVRDATPSAKGARRWTANSSASRSWRLGNGPMATSSRFAAAAIERIGSGAWFLRRNVASAGSLLAATFDHVRARFAGSAIERLKQRLADVDQLYRGSDLGGRACEASRANPSGAVTCRCQ